MNNRNQCCCGGGGGRKRGCGLYVVAVVMGILVSMLAPVWVCFWLICGLIALLCFL